MIPTGERVFGQSKGNDGAKSVLPNARPLGADKSRNPRAGACIETG